MALVPSDLGSAGSPLKVSVSSEETMHSKEKRDIPGGTLSKEEKSYALNEASREVSVQQSNSVSQTTQSVQSSRTVQSSSVSQKSSSRSVEQSEENNSTDSNGNDVAQNNNESGQKVEGINDTQHGRYNSANQNGGEQQAVAKKTETLNMQGSGNEIKQESIKNTLKEIISEIDQAVANQEQQEEIKPNGNSEPPHLPDLTETNVPLTDALGEPRARLPANLLEELSTDFNGGPPKKIDFEKIFTPATDVEEIKPQKNRVMYASSAFYSSNFHPTVEDQVALARKISSSLSDQSNSHSKGLSMYANRKKRSVQWVHEGDGQSESYQSSMTEEESSPGANKSGSGDLPLKLLMNPRGHVQDINSLMTQQGSLGYEPAPLSPEVTFDVVNALNATKGKGAELFAKRRKKSEKWVVDEVAVNLKLANSGLHADVTLSAGTSTPSAVPQSGIKLPPLSYLEGGTLRAQNTLKLNQIQQQFSQPRLKMVKSPWEAALETGSVESAFQELSAGPRLFPAPLNETPAHPPVTMPLGDSSNRPPCHTCPQCSDNSKDYLYKGRAPRGWNSNFQPNNGSHYTSFSQLFAPQYGSYENSKANSISEDCISVLPPMSHPTEILASPSKDLYQTFSQLSSRNYNTAARGWGQEGYYRPVTF